MATAEDPLFNINFIRAIENRPCLWNYSLSEYSKRNKTEKAWIERAKVKDLVSNCRERWRNIRGAFLRSLKKPPSGSGSNTKKKYYLGEYLQFLLPYTKSKTSTGNLETLVEYNDNSEGEFEERTEESEIESQEVQGNRITTAPNSPLEVTEEIIRPATDETIITPDKGNIFKKRKVAQTPSTTSNSADDAFVAWLNNKKEGDNINDHPNLSFLRSLLPDMMRMTVKQKNRRFRQKVISLMDDILEDTDINVYTCYSSASNSTWNTNRSSFESYNVPLPNPSPNLPTTSWRLEEQGVENSSSLDPYVPPSTHRPKLSRSEWPN